MPVSRTAQFAPTRWTLVMRASAGDSRAGAAMSELCGAYYAPVVAFLRSEGRDEDAARELAHGFFGRLLGGGSLGGADPMKGKFRSYLLGAVKHFLRDERLRAQAEKRGGGAQHVILEKTAALANEATPEPLDSERAFDRQWALTVISRALDAVAGRFREAGKSKLFEHLKPWITGDSTEMNQADAAAALGLSGSAVKVAIHRLRQNFREAVKAEILQTVPADDDVDEELRYLIAVLAR